MGLAGEISPLQLELLALMGSYKDLYHPETYSVTQGPQVCGAYCLHVLKANSQVLAHNALLRELKTQAKPGAEPQDEPRDQGLTRPKGKVLILVPFQGGALRAGQTHDSRVLRHSPLYRRALSPPPGHFILADGGYPCLQHPLPLITPYKRPLQGVGAQRFNGHHSRARCIMERALE
ncbi:hypothetical protein VZT92_001912 [Zoarces viviparus]|uniref:UTP25 NTP hydrolase-like domain-containing protein n=1 Tax=Zoarces viviparus TaxID=48416 RepID=A0AAW1G3L6_ZOAVI